MTENYSMQVGTFLFKKAWGELFKSMDDEQLGKLIKHVYLYTEGNEETPDDPAIKAPYKMITGELNRSCKRYVERNKGNE